MILPLPAEAMPVVTPPPPLQTITPVAPEPVPVPVPLAFAWNFGHGDCARPLVLGVVTFRVAFWTAPLGPVAVMLAVTVVETPTVVTANVVELEPAGTVTDAGTLADAWSLLSVTLNPVAAGLPKAMVPVEDPPPTTAVGFKDSPVSTAGVIVRPTPIELGDTAAVIFATVGFATGLVVTVNVAVVAPLATVTLAGIVADGLDEVNVTFSPA